jgi:hypothetical protein
MDLTDISLGPDENCVLQYLNNFPNDFISEREIARRADGRRRFAENAHWAHIALSELVENRFIETDGLGKYRMKRTSLAAGEVRKFISPQFRTILENCGPKFDLSSYA